MCRLSRIGCCLSLEKRVVKGSQAEDGEMSTEASQKHIWIPPATSFCVTEHWDDLNISFISFIIINISQWYLNDISMISQWSPKNLKKSWSTPGIHPLTGLRGRLRRFRLPKHGHSTPCTPCRIVLRSSQEHMERARNRGPNECHLLNGLQQCLVYV